MSRRMRAIKGGSGEATPAASPRSPGSRRPAAGDDVAVDPRYAAAVTVQDYRLPAAIDGVALVDLVRASDDGGAFVEIARLESGILKARPGFAIRQINYAVMQPGTIKAFHLHLRQSEFWFVAPEARVLVGLLDVRDGSATRGRSMRLLLGDGRARLLFVPAGVAHGLASLSDRAWMVYLADQEFDPDPARCDERRLPWDTLGAEFWDTAKG